MSAWQKNGTCLLAGLAGVLYSSWPLGLLLNPAVAHHQLASELEATNQPYAWLFLLLDVVSGLLVLVVAARQWRGAARSPVLQAGIAGYVLFALFVIAAALSPDSCVAGARNCLAMPHSPTVIIHGFSSFTSVIFLFFSLILPVRMLAKRRRWLAGLAVLVIVGWGVTGLGTLIVLAHGAPSNWLQYIFITVSSLSLVVAVRQIEQLSPAKLANR